MNRLIIALTCLLSITWTLQVQAQEQTWREMPYYLKGYEAEYAKSPNEAALAWFKDARFGLFIHRGPASLYAQGEWVMYTLQRQKSKEEVWELPDNCAKLNSNLLLNIAPYPDGRIQEENIKTLKEVGERIEKRGFPKLNTKDYMDCRMKSVQKVRKEKINQIANKIKTRHHDYI